MAMTEDRDHARSADTLRVIQHRVLEAGILELRHTRVRQRDHVFFRAELQAAGGTRFDARRLEPHFDAIDAERALRHLSGLLAELRNFKRTAGGAVAAADALGLIDIDDAVRVLHDGAGCRARLETAGLRAV